MGYMLAGVHPWGKMSSPILTDVGIFFSSGLKPRPRKVCELPKWILPRLDLGGGFKYVLFSRLFGEDFQFD